MSPNVPGEAPLPQKTAEHVQPDRHPTGGVLISEGSPSPNGGHPEVKKQKVKIEINGREKHTNFIRVNSYI